VIVVGLLSGTSMDSIDAAVADLRWDGDTIRLRPLGHHTRPWPEELRARALAALPPAPVSAQELCELDAELGQEFAAAAKHVSDGADLIVSHGQTVCHWVDGDRARGTLQLGQPAWIVEATGLPVVSDLRSRDVAAGGHGAPLAVTLDALWLAGGPLPAAALNLGGIANVTLVTSDAPPVAYDTGPANCLLDVTAARITEGRLAYDADGRLAAAGSVRPDLLDRLLAEPYFARRAPKSTSRELFHAGFIDAALAGLDAVSDADLLATLAELTAVTIARACATVPLTRVVASGGGVRNPTLMSRLAHHLGSTELIISDELGLPGDAKEAYLFALLGLLTWYQVPGVPLGATGSAVPRVLGRISPGNTPLQLPAPARSPAGLIVVI
jgi:anhydro-N-acetylmuramic acid kinase